MLPRSRTYELCFILNNGGHEAPSKGSGGGNDDMNGFRWLYGFLSLVFGIFLSCSAFDPQVLRDAPGTVPETYGLYDFDPYVPSPWWESMASVELSRLIDEALTGSFTIHEAWARLSQRRSIARRVGADRYPDITAGGDAEATRKSTSSASGSMGDQAVSLWLAGSYELDLWGRVRSEREAASLDVAASREDLLTARVTVAGEVADRWVQILSQRQQIQLLEKQLENNVTFLDLIELRFQKAMVSALDVYQQKQAVESIRARIPLVQAQTQLLTHELAVLLGRPPGFDLGLTQEQMPVLDSLPAVGLPADLLANRPDVRAAGIRLKSAQWQVSAARANRLPSLSLTAGAQYGPSDLDLLFDTWLLRLAANLTAPVFDGGRRAAQVDLASAQMDENLWAYRRTVLTAIKEVEDVLVNETRQREHLNGLEAVKSAADKGLQEAISRYRNGLSDYLPVLTQLLTVQDLERNLIDQRAQLIRYRIGLHRALGGGLLADSQYAIGKPQELESSIQEPE